MLDGIVFGTIGWVMSNPDDNTDFFGQLLQVFFEDVVARTIASSSVTQDQNGCGVRIVILSLDIPPISDRITGKFASVLAGTQGDEAGVSFEIIDAVRDDHPFSQAGKVVVQGLQFFQGVQVTVTIEIAQILFLLGVHTENRVVGKLEIRNQSSDILKLFISVRNLLHRSFLLSLATAVISEVITLHGLFQANIPIIYGGLISVGIAYTLQVVAQREAHPAHAAIILSLEAVFAAVGGWLILDETLSMRGSFGCALMLAGMLLSQLRTYIFR